MVKELAQKRLKRKGTPRFVRDCSVRKVEFRPCNTFDCSFQCMDNESRARCQFKTRTSSRRVQYSKRALDLGRSLWKDVPRTDRGSIFEHSFLIGVRNMYLHTLMCVGRESIFLGR